MTRKRVRQIPVVAKHVEGQQPDTVRINKVDRRPDGTLRVRTIPKLAVSEDLSSFYVDWDATNVLAAIAVLNALPAADLPEWLLPLPIPSADVFCKRMMKYVVTQAHSGPLIGHNLIASNTLTQGVALAGILSWIGVTPAFQGLTALPLGTYYCMGNEKAITTATRIGLPSTGVQIIADHSFRQ